MGQVSVILFHSKLHWLRLRTNWHSKVPGTTSTTDALLMLSHRVRHAHVSTDGCAAKTTMWAAACGAKIGIVNVYALGLCGKAPPPQDVQGDDFPFVHPNQFIKFGLIRLAKIALGNWATGVESGMPVAVVSRYFGSQIFCSCNGEYLHCMHNNNVFALRIPLVDDNSGSFMRCVRPCTIVTHENRLEVHRIQQNFRSLLDWIAKEHKRSCAWWHEKGKKQGSSTNNVETPQLFTR